MSVRVRLLIPLIVLLFLLVFLAIKHGHDYVTASRDAISLRQWLASWETGAPLALVVLQACQVILAPIPGHVLGVVSGYLFGMGWGTLYSMLGTTLGSLIAIALARAYGRPLVKRLLRPDLLSQLDSGIEKRGLFFFLLVFLLPFVPDDAACYVAGLTRIPIPALMLTVLAGRLPGIFVSSWLGASAGGLSLSQWAMIILASVLLALIFLIHGHDLETFAVRLAQRLSRSAQSR